MGSIPSALIDEGRLPQGGRPFSRPAAASRASVRPGAVWRLMPKLGLGLELAVEVGPLVAPFTAAYAAGHVAAVAAWSL